MAEVASYHVLVYGGPDGYQTNRAQIQLSDAAGRTLAWLRFNDPGMFYEADSDSGGIIKMHLPSAMFQSILDVLRNEKPINIYFAQGRGFFGTSTLDPWAKANSRPNSRSRGTPQKRGVLQPERREGQVISIRRVLKKFREEQV